MMSKAFPEQAGWPALWSMVIGFFMILVDTTIVVIALPTIMASLNADIGEAIWVTSAYLLAYAVPLLVAGRLGDRFGPRTLYLVGLAIFTLASLACGLSSTITMLIIARIVQGVGAALMTPQTMAVITRTFRPERRGPAMGLWGSAAGVAVLVGPLLGGMVVVTLGWEWTFFINVPVGLIGFVLAWINVPRLPIHRHHFDWLGVALSGIGMFCLVFGIEEGQAFDWGVIWGPITVWSLIGFGVLMMIIFVLWQRRAPEPLVPLSIFRDRNFSAAAVGICAMGFIVTAQGFPTVLYSQSARGLSPAQSALLMIPMAVLSGILAPLVGTQLGRRSPRTFALCGFGLLIISLVCYGQLMRPDISVWWLLIPSGVSGIASAGIWGPLAVAATRNLRPRIAGAGAGVYNTMRQVGAVLGSASVAAFMQSRVLANLGLGVEPGPGTPLPPAIVEPFSVAMGQTLVLPAGVAVIGMLCAALLVWHGPGQQSATAPADARARLG